MFAHKQLEDSATRKMKEASGLKKVEGVFDSNQRVRKSTVGRSKLRVMTNSKCLADEMQLRIDDPKTKSKLRNEHVSVSAGRNSRDGNVSFPRHAVSGDWDLQEWTSVM